MKTALLAMMLASVTARAQEGSVVQQATAPKPPAWTDKLAIGGGVILWYYQPFQDGAKNNFNLYFANLLIDGKFGDLGLHLEPRFRADKLRPFYDGPAWVQEVYAYGALGKSAVFKAGKVYSHFGLFWDNCFYGNVQVFDGLKLDTDYGVSLEGAWRDQARFGFHYWAQVFLIDGETNVSLPGRDTVSITGARRRNQLIGRWEPVVRLTDHATLKGGLSAEYLQADLPAPVGKQDVYRGAADATLVVGHASVWGEFQRQNGQTVTDFPISGTPATMTTPAVEGKASAHNNYVLVGGEYTWKRLTGRYNFSWGDYTDVGISERIHEPAIGFTVNDNLALLGELVLWNRSAPTGDSTVDQSVNITLHGHF